MRECSFDGVPSIQYVQLNPALTDFKKQVDYIRYRENLVKANKENDGIHNLESPRISICCKRKFLTCRSV